MRIENLIELFPDTYTPADCELILRAYRVAERAHEGQKRASGEAYISHCLAVAAILAELHVPPSVMAAPGLGIEWLWDEIERRALAHHRIA